MGSAIVRPGDLFPVQFNYTATTFGDNVYSEFGTGQVNTSAFAGDAIPATPEGMRVGISMIEVFMDDGSGQVFEIRFMGDGTTKRYSSCARAGGNGRIFRRSWGIPFYLLQDEDFELHIATQNNGPTEVTLQMGFFR